MLINSYRYALWTPAQITTALWLDAADATTVTTVSGAVSQWNDKSGNGRNFSQSTQANQPTYTSSVFNGKPVIRFDGSNDVLARADFLSGSGYVSFICVLAIRSGSEAGQRFISITKNSGGAEFGIYLARLSNNPDLTIVSYSIGGRRLVSDTFTELRREIYFDNSPVIYEGIHNYQGTTQTLRLNGTQTNTNTSFQTAGNMDTGLSNIGIGGQFNGGVTCIALDAGEIICLTSDPESNNRQRIEGYLAHKWGLTANLPSDHPYKNSAPTA